MPHKRAKRSVREQLRTQKGADLAPTKQSISNEAVPKSVSRVLNAAQIREDWKVKKRKFEEEGEGKKTGKRRKVEGEDIKGKSQAKASVVHIKGSAKLREKGKILGIQPGESLQHFNRRVEDDMRPLVKSAMQTSLAVSRNVRKSELEAKAQAKKNKNTKPQVKSKAEVGDDVRSPSPSPPPSQKHADRPKEFPTTSSSAPRRLNDIAQAPPEFKKLPRGAVHQVISGGSAARSGKRDGVLSMAQKLRMEEEREKAITRYREMKAKRRRAGIGGGDERDRDGVEEDEGEEED